MNNRKFLSCPTAAVAFALMSGTLAFAQGPATLAGLTPNEVHTGAAKLLGHSDPKQMLRLVIGLQHPHLAEEEEFLRELGTKGSTKFQKFLTADEWNRRFAPTAADEQAVVEWATSQGLTVSHRFGNRLLVDIEAPVENVERALGVSINSYQVGARVAFSNDRDPVIPAALSGIVHSVGGLNSIQVYVPKSKLPEPNFQNYVAGPAIAAAGSGAHDAVAGSKKPASLTGPTANITGGAYDPTDIYSSQAYDVQALYNQGHCCNPNHASGVTPPESSIAIATAGTQNGSDFAGFHNSYPYLADHWQQFYIDGTPSCCDGEGTLDFDWSTAWSNSFGSYVDTAMIYMYDGANNQFSTFTDVYNHILNDQHAKVFSTSWGCKELACTPQSVMDTDHGIFNAMVGQGMTLVAATGDQGATADCDAALGVQYPASDPNIVGAGGTTLRLYSNGNFYSETGWEGGPYGCGSNDGGSTGGRSAYYSTPSYQSSLGVSSRALPDISLNADWYNTPQNYFFNGSLSGNGGTSIVAPEVAGFFAQANSYMDFVASKNGGCYGGTTCAPIGNGNWYLYYFGENKTYAPHYPFYDVTSGCNDNDITATYGVGYWCAGAGYDEVTGWGSFNALQLAWAINTYRAGDFGQPGATFSGPATNHWFNTDQLVSWTVADTGSGSLPATGVAGFSRAWDAPPTNAFSEPHGGSGDSFYSGPQFVNATSGSIYISSAGQGCHTANVRSWDNSGFSANNTYGPVCYDSVAPVSSATLSGTLSGGVYVSSVHVTESATDANSGVASKLYSLDGGSYVTYSAPFTVSSTGSHTVTIYSRDVAGNSETPHSYSFIIKSPTTSAVVTSLTPSVYGQAVKFTATVHVSFGSTPTGTVTFKDGATILGTGALSAGVTTFTTSKLHGGSHSITASYGGSGNDAASTSGALTQKVTAASSKTTLTSSANPSNYGSAVTFTATVASANGGSVMGTVLFKSSGTLIGTVAVNTTTNKATFTYPNFSVGNHYITASYGGSTDDTASASTQLTQVVKAATTTTAVVGSPNPAAHGAPVTFTATITPAKPGTVTGTVTFKSFGVAIGTGTVGSGNKATFTYSGFGVGNHVITATYGGSSNYVASTSPQVTEVVN